MDSPPPAALWRRGYFLASLSSPLSRTGHSGLGSLLVPRDEHNHRAIYQQPRPRISLPSGVLVLGGLSCVLPSANSGRKRIPLILSQRRDSISSSSALFAEPSWSNRWPIPTNWVASSSRCASGRSALRLPVLSVFPPGRAAQPRRKPSPGSVRK